MTCPTCQEKTSVIDTREIKPGETRRRHRCKNGHRFSTVESFEKYTERFICAATGLRRYSIWTAYKKTKNPWECKGCGSYHLTPLENSAKPMAEI